MDSQSDLARKFDPTGQLYMLKGMTAKLGGLHEAQALQLRLWPFAVDPEINKNRVEVNIEEKGQQGEMVQPGIVIFHLEAARPSDWKPDVAYMARLREMVWAVKKVLLGDSYSVEIRMNTNPIFTSGANDPNVERPTEQKQLPFWKRLLGRSE